MDRETMIEEYVEQYHESMPDECEREMRKELQCMSDEELLEEYTAYMS